MPLRVTGLTQVRKSFDRLPSAMAYEVNGPMALAVAEEVASKAKRSHPYRDRTGQLTRSIRAEKIPYTYRVGGRSVRVPFGAAIVRADHPALFVEFGHGGPAPARPYPFIRPAIIRTRTRQFQQAYREGLRKFPAALRRARRG